MKEVKVRDFMIDLSKVDNKKVKSTKKIQTRVEYKIVLENDMDFVVKRTTSKTDKDLVFLVSQELFYIRDNRKDIIQTLDRNNNYLKNFLKDVDLENFSGFEKVKWTKRLSIEKLEMVIVNKKMRLCVKNGIYKTNIRTVDTIGTYLTLNKKIFNYMYDKIGYRESTTREVYSILEKVDYNNAKYLVDCLNDTKIYFDTYGLSNISENLSIYNLDTNTYIEYLTYGLLQQGIKSISYSILGILDDYLKMCKDMYGKVKIKYPKNLKTDHDRLSAKYTLWKKYKDDLSVLENMKEWECLKFTKDVYSIILPQTSSDIIDEGQNQSHCVASYVDKVVNNETIIVFMRFTDDIDTSLITIEVKDKEIKQVRGFGNRLADKEEVKFIKKWAKEKELKILEGVF